MRRHDVVIGALQMGSIRQVDWRSPMMAKVLSASLATLFCSLILLACWMDLTRPGPMIDFISFWNSARLVVSGHASAVYSVQHSPFGAIMPLPYPPPFLLLIAPFGLLSFGAAFVVWTLATGALYLWAARSKMALANPAAAFNGIIGQTDFLTTGLMLTGVERPAFLGVLVIKPHLALLVPVALVAGKRWKALRVAALSAAALLLLSLVVFGPGAYRGFFAVAAQFAALLEAGRWPWSDIASVFGVARWFGAPAIAAWLAHGIVALGAIVVTGRAWREDWPTKLPVLCAATLLISPYLFAYSAVLMFAPLAWLARERPRTAAIVWLLLAIQLARIFGFYGGPNTVPIAALVVLAGALAQRAAEPELASAATSQDNGGEMVKEPRG